MSVNKHLSPVRVLVVDDSKMIRSISHQRLVAAGYEVTLAEDGFDALSAIVESCPDIILLDVMMPEIDGYETCRLIKGHKKYSRIPTIMLSANDKDSARTKGYRAGFDYCLSKPFNETELNAIIAKALGRERIAV